MNAVDEKLVKLQETAALKIPFKDQDKDFKSFKDPDTADAYDKKDILIF